MVATIKVLQGGAKAISKYHGLMDSSSDYYMEQSYSEWFGKAARWLGLGQCITRSDFENVLAGRSPSGHPLGRIRPDAPTAQRKRVPGYDITFSVPKSVSILWAVGDVRVQHQVREALLTAVRSTLSELESDLPLARRGKGGKTEISADLIVGMFLHELSRANDPNLHAHCIVANACFGSDKQWSAVNSRKLHDWTMTLGGIFRSHLCRELQERLNVTYRDGVGRDGSIGDWKEVAEIPKSLVDHFSTRSSQIEQAVDGDRLQDSHTRQRANFATRPSKDEPHNRDAQRIQWRDEARIHGIHWEQLSASLADQSANPDIHASRERLQHLTKDVELFESDIKDSTVPTPLEPVPEEVEAKSDVPPEIPQRSEPQESQSVQVSIDPIAELFGELPEQAPGNESVKTTENGPTERDSSAQPCEEANTVAPEEQAPQSRHSPVTTRNPPEQCFTEKGSLRKLRQPRDLTRREEKLYEKRFIETAEYLAETRAYYSASDFARSLGKQLRLDNIDVPNLIERVRRELDKREEIVVLPHTQRPLYSSRTYFEKETSLVEDAKTLRDCRMQFRNTSIAVDFAFPRAPRPHWSVTGQNPMPSNSLRNTSFSRRRRNCGMRPTTCASRSV